MSLLSSSVSITRYTVHGKLNAPIIDNIIDGLTNNTIAEIDNQISDKAVGWTSFDKPFQPNFDGSSFVFGNFFYVYMYMIGLARYGHWDLLKYVFFIPLYWILMSFAALKAFYQLIFNPHYWEKTRHGLSFGFIDRDKRLFIDKFIQIDLNLPPIKKPSFGFKLPNWKESLKKAMN